jgi:hypothetical protein
VGGGEMITLNIAIYDGEVMKLNFEDTTKLMEYIELLKYFDCVWLIAGGNEILVTESLKNAYEYIRNGFFFLFGSEQVLHIHEYESYEDAYKVALDMREASPKCYAR